MEVSIQTIDTKKGTVDYILSELRKLIHMQPHEEKRINLSLSLAKPEYFRVKKDEVREVFVLSWYKNEDFMSRINVRVDNADMVKDVEGLVEGMENIV